MTETIINEGLAGLELATRKRIRRNDWRWFGVILLVCLLWIGDHCREKVNHATELKDVKKQAGFELAKFCGRISKENQRDYITIKK